MIHVATVHWRSDRWIDLQRRYLERYLDKPHLTYAFLTDVSEGHAKKFFYWSSEAIGDHATKLNLLADVIRFNASDPSDLLLFIDGDAFPIAPIAPLVRERLDDHRLIAIQRFENNGDIQPHPSFCLTTVGFWQELGGNWHPGHRWRDLSGNTVTDVGGNLLALLDSTGIKWYPLRRMNNVNLHAVFFGLYGDRTHGSLVYHHGAGFREGLSRVDFVQGSLDQARKNRLSRISGTLPKGSALRALLDRYDPVRRQKLQLIDDLRQQSDQLISAMSHDEEFWRTLT